MENKLDLQFKEDSPENGSARLEPKNLLPYDGEVLYYGPIFDRKKSDEYLRYFLHDIPWKNDEVILYGKHFVTARKIAWYGREGDEYTYSGKTRIALKWTPELLEVKSAVERISGVEYNSCLLNLYENGDQGMGWHQDNEKVLGKGANIASVTFGAERRFDLRHKTTKGKVSVYLEHGALLIMKGATQTYWYHQIPKSKKITEPRINMTFRKML